MLKPDFETFVNGIGNDLKISIDDLTGLLLNIHGDVEDLKVNIFKPKKEVAEALLEYISMEESKAKKNLEVICGSEIQQHLKWLESYCKKYEYSQEEGLNRIINEES